jgi:hypothetical protein
VGRSPRSVFGKSLFDAHGWSFPRPERPPACLELFRSAFRADKCVVRVRTQKVCHVAAAKEAAVGAVSFDVVVKAHGRVPVCADN